MKMKKNGLLLIILSVFLLSGIFTATEDASAYKCMHGASCQISVVTGLSYCFYNDPGFAFWWGSTCSGHTHTCSAEASLLGLDVCLINKLSNQSCCPSCVGCDPNYDTFMYCSETRCNPTNCAGGCTNDEGSSLNGEECWVSERMAGLVSSPSGLDVNNTDNFVKGVWDYLGDASGSGQCIECGTNNKEITIYGDSSDLYFNGIAGNGFFEFACGADESCDEKVEGDSCNPPAGGACNANGKCEVPIGVLILSATASPDTIIPGATSTITFEVTLDGAAESGVTVGTITHDGGGSLSATTCTTDTAGICTVTYTGHTSPEVVTVTAAKATNGVDTDSGSVSVIITVNLAGTVPACGVAIGIPCNPLRGTVNTFSGGIVIVIRYLLAIVGIITLTFMVISGVKYTTSVGNEEKMKSAKDAFLSSITGLVIALMAFVILEIIVRILNG